MVSDERGNRFKRSPRQNSQKRALSGRIGRVQVGAGSDQDGEASVLPSPAARSRGLFPSPFRYSMSAFASTAAFSSATAPRHDSSSTLTSPDAVVPARARHGVLRVASRRRRALDCAIGRSGGHKQRTRCWQRPGTIRRVDERRAQTRCSNHGGLSTGPKTLKGPRRISEARRARWKRQRTKNIGDHL